MLDVCSGGSLKDERSSQKEMETCFSIKEGGDDFADFSAGNLLDSIDFDDLFVGINDADVLPDLEMDSEILAEFSLSGGEESSAEILNTNTTSSCFDNTHLEADDNWRKDDDDDDTNNNHHKVEKAAAADADESGVAAGLVKNTAKNPTPLLKESSSSSFSSTSSGGGGDQKARKQSSSANQSKNSQLPTTAAAKRKVKVDWTPELHRRFVQAVEQLGVDKAVPSRILEIMGIDCLTRHNIASHLQKYRSHRKHLLAREAEAASWNQRRQMYGGGAAVGSGIAPPTIGFPPVAPMPPHFRPLHVWGHPSVDQSLMHLWPKHLGPSPPPAWPPADSSFWRSHHQRAPSSVSPGTPCFVPPPMPAAARFPTPALPCIPASTSSMYKGDPGGVGVLTLPVPKPPVDFQPSKESIDAAIGDVLSEPWLPLPLRLKPPSVDSVLVELQRQGISKVPPTITSTSISLINQ